MSSRSKRSFPATRPADFVPRSDREIVLDNIRSQLLTLETIRPWEKNADTYSSTCANAAFVLMERKFAPPNDRLRSLIAREKQMPALLAAARANLQNPPRIFTEIAIEQLPGIIGFFKHDVPQAFADADDPALKAEFAATNAAVVAALNDYLALAQNRSARRAPTATSASAPIPSRKSSSTTRWSTCLSTSCSKSAGPICAKIRTTSSKSPPSSSPEKIRAPCLKSWAKIIPLPISFSTPSAQPSTASSVSSASTTSSPFPPMSGPSSKRRRPSCAPPTFASMDTAGPFETHATESYFNVTLPDPSMTPAEVEGYMHGFNIGTVISTAVHEAYPGHYVQFLWLPQAPSKVRKLLGANTDVEGWAHYCEQMMLDEGYGQPGAGAKDEREAKLLRLGQLQDALLRNARFIVGIEMHTGNMTIEQAEDFFQKEGYQSKETAVVETKRGAGDPTYLYYTLGKLEIMKLREDVKKKEGAAFSLEKFHDDFLRQGFPPIKIVREAMLGDDSPTL